MYHHGPADCTCTCTAPGCIVNVHVVQSRVTWMYYPRQADVQLSECMCSPIIEQRQLVYQEKNRDKSD